jgi:hypothetical protein
MLSRLLVVFLARGPARTEFCSRAGARAWTVSCAYGSARLVSWLLGALLFLAPRAAQAWTEAHVREVHATLTVDAGDKLQVALDLALEVRGGWLERLELPGLDEGLVLAEQEPVLAILESGERVPAQFSVRGSTLILKFVRRDGLRRGLHHIVLHYAVDRSSPASMAGRESVRLDWTLPGFEAGLARATVTVRGPRTLQAVDAPDVAQEVAVRDDAGSRALTFSRLHIPRATPWTIAIALPASLVPGERGGAGASQVATRPAHDYRTSVLLVLASLALACAMRRSATRSLALEGLLARGLLSRRPLSALALIGLSVLAAFSVPFLPALAVASWALLFVLGVPQAKALRGPLPLGSFRVLTRAELRAATRARWRALLGVPWADITTVLGAAGALSLIVVAGAFGGFARFGREPWSLLALSALFGFIASARSLRARSFAEQVTWLLWAARRARAVGCAFSLVVYASKGRLAQPRLRVVPSVRYPGLLRLELLVDTRRSARVLVLSALVEADSAAERWLSALLPDAQREGGEGGRRVALLCPVDDAGKAAERVLEHLSRESQRILFQTAGNAHAA